MTRAEIHQRALQAAAKATLSITALGCGGPREPAGPATGHPTTTVDVPPQRSQPTTTTTSAAVPTAAPSARRLSCLSAGPPYSKEQIDCCALVVKNELASRTEPLSQLSAEQDQCCRLIVEEGDARRAPGKDVGLSHGDSYVCCNYLDPMLQGSTCSPWGPPMPPGMIAALLDERFA